MQRFTHLLEVLALSIPAFGHAATVRVTIEEAGAMTADLAAIGATASRVETFDTVPLGALKSHNSVLGHYAGGTVKAADLFGGAGETGYLYTNGATGSTLTLDAPARYFGFWWSAGSGGNTVSLRSGGKAFFSFDTDDVIDFLKTHAADPAAYYGNPNPSWTGWVGHEPFAFINMFSETEFDSILFSGANFESDNHTIATRHTGVSGTDVSPVPLPASLGFLLAGLGALAVAARRRRTA